MPATMTIGMKLALLRQGICKVGQVRSRDKIASRLGLADHVPDVDPVRQYRLLENACDPSLFSHFHNAKRAMQRVNRQGGQCSAVPMLRLKTGDIYIRKRIAITDDHGP